MFFGGKRALHPQLPPKPSGRSMDKNQQVHEDPFDLIQRGHAFHSSSSHWSATDAFSRASLALRHRTDASSKQSANTEHQKISSLYRTQSLEYFYKARGSLLVALTFENDQDRMNTCHVARLEAVH